MSEGLPIRDASNWFEKHEKLMKAAKKEDLETMERLVKEQDLVLDYAEVNDGESLLNMCITSGAIKSFEKLLELGANPDWQDTPHAYANPYVLPIVQATRVGSNSKFLELLLKYGANPNPLAESELGYNNETPLLIAVSYYLWDHVKLLVENGADVNLTKDSMITPLAQSLVNYDIEMAKYLIDHGADFNNLKFETKTIVPDGQILTSNGYPIMINIDERNILDYLRGFQFSLDAVEYKIKMEVVDFLQIQGLDYWKYPIPEEVRNEHKDDPEYLLKY